MRVAVSSRPVEKFDTELKLPDWQLEPDDEAISSNPEDYYYVDEQGKHTGYEDVFTKIEMCRRHYVAVGLGADYIDQFIR